jgi:predicted aldo/keto reductase-like oxidoreductase
MGNMDMVLDNTSYMKNFQPLTAEEREAVAKVCNIMKKQDAIACTACRYCTEVCPQGIDIPVLFACLNDHRKFKNWNSSFYYNSVHTADGGKASSCIVCGQCEKICPQHLEIRKLLKTVADTFEK